jgi:multidrug efflux pump subunit AcrB
LSIGDAQGSLQPPRLRPGYRLTHLAITRHWATIAIFVALAIAGISAFVALPINEFPQVNIPVVTVSCSKR